MGGAEALGRNRPFRSEGSRLGRISSSPRSKHAVPRQLIRNLIKSGRRREMGFKKLSSSNPAPPPPPISCDIHTRHSGLTKGRMRRSFWRRRHRRGAGKREVSVPTRTNRAQQSAPWSIFGRREEVGSLRAACWIQLIWVT